MPLKKVIAPWEWIYLIALTIGAVALRFWFVANIPTMQLYDFSTYHEIASNIYRFHEHSLLGQPVAWQGMGYAGALGLFYILMDNDWIQTAKVFNCLISSLSLPLVFLIFRKLSSSKLVVYGAYTTVALLPNFIAYNNVVGTEVFFTFLFLLVITLQVYHFDNRLRYPLLGIAIGLAALTKPFFIAYPLVAALYLWLRNKNLRETMVMLTTLVILTALAVAPWTIRNYRSYGTFIPVSYNSGYVLYVNNNDLNTSGSWMPLKDVPASPALQKEIEAELARNQDNEKLAAGLDAILKPAAQEWIMDNPGSFAELGLLRLKQTFFAGAWDISSWAMNEMAGSEDQPKTAKYLRHLNTFYAAADILVYILCTCGILYLLLNIKPLLVGLFSRSRRLSDLILIPTLNTAFFVAIYFVFEGQARYNFPLLFIFALCMWVMLQKTSAD